MRNGGFAQRNVFASRIARWLLIIAAGSTATACSGDRLARTAANAPPGHNASAGDPGSVEAALDRGAGALARQDETGARRAFEAAQKLQPKNPEAAFRLGEIELTQGAAKAASDQFAIALESRKDDPKLYNAIGVALAMQGRYDLAKENYDKGLALAPDNSSLHNNYGLMQLARGDLNGALATFSALVASPQATDRYRLNRALVELALGQRAAALADAPGIDEAGLRQTLAIYWTPLRAQARATGSAAGAPSALAGSDESALPNVHLAIDPRPAAAPATSAAMKPVEGLPATVSP